MSTRPGRVPWNSSVLRLALASTLTAVLGVTLVSPLLPAIGREFGVPDAQASLIITVYTLPGIVLAPVAGALADRYGRRPILSGSLLVTAICGVAVVRAGSLPAVLVLRTAQGVGASGVLSVAVTLLGDAFEGPQRNAALGVNAAAISVGAAVYPLLGGVLGEGVWRRPFWLYAAGVPIAVFAWRGLAAPPSTADRESGLAYLRNAVGALPRTAWLLFGASVAGYALLFGGLLTAVPFLLTDSFGLPAARIGVILSAGAVSTAVVAAVNGRLVQRSPPQRLVVAGFGCYGVGLIGVFLAPTPLAVAIAALVVGAGQGLTLPSIDGLVGTLAPARYRAGVFGVRTSVIALGATVGPAVFAAGGGHAGYRPTLLAGGVFALACAAVGIGLGAGEPS
ncbi:MFS transporter [Haloarcula halophila]|uniref:MFS transporter n=1 Tax=Haloarcula TaxID=2237 RepID=UPI0023E44F35|nr:MFS transporter [Halomicroarcula sp. DFY41]